MICRLTSTRREVECRQGMRTFDLLVYSSHRDFDYSLGGKAQLSERRPTEIDEYWMPKGASIRYADDDTLAVVETGDTEPGIEGKEIACRDCGVVHVVDLAVSHHVAVKELAVPSRDAVEGSEWRRLRGAGACRHYPNLLGEIAGEGGDYGVIANPMVEDISLEPNGYDLAHRLRRRDGQPKELERSLIRYVGVVDRPIAGQLADAMLVYCREVTKWVRR